MRLIAYWQAHCPELPVPRWSIADNAALDSNRIFTVTVNNATPAVIMHRLTKVDATLWGYTRVASDTFKRMQEMLTRHLLLTSKIFYFQIDLHFQTCFVKASYKNRSPTQQGVALTRINKGHPSIVWSLLAVNGAQKSVSRQSLRETLCSHKGRNQSPRGMRLLI